MTLQEAKSIARHLGLTLRKVRSGDYRVNFRDGNETTACYTDNLEDAINTAVEMARKRASVVQEFESLRARHEINGLARSVDRLSGLGYRYQREAPLPEQA